MRSSSRRVSNGHRPHSTSNGFATPTHAANRISNGSTAGKRNSSILSPEWRHSGGGGGQKNGGYSPFDSSHLSPNGGGREYSFSTAANEVSRRSGRFGVMSDDDFRIDMSELGVAPLDETSPIFHPRTNSRIVRIVSKHSNV